MLRRKQKHSLKLSIPSFKNDVTREADVIEEVLRVYGYDRITGSGQLKVPLIALDKKSPEQLRNLVSDALTSQGFNEDKLNNSLTKAAYVDTHFAEQGKVKVDILNPLSTDLNAMRQSLLFGGFGKVFHVTSVIRIRTASSTNSKSIREEYQRRVAIQRVLFIGYLAYRQMAGRTMDFLPKEAPHSIIFMASSSRFYQGLELNSQFKMYKTRKLILTAWSS